MSATIVLFRHDLRLADNPALEAAHETGPVVPVYIHAPDEEGSWKPGAASRWWLHQSLRSLDTSLRNIGSRLIIRTGPTLAAIRDVVRETAATSVFWNRRYEPAVIERDRLLKSELKKQGLRTESYNASLLFEPWEVETKQGRPYQVYTPFWNAVKDRPLPKPSPAPHQLTAPRNWPNSFDLAALELEPRIDWAAQMRKQWTPGEKGAVERLKRFTTVVDDYADGRNRPDYDGTSSLSPHLHLGEISPRTVWHATVGDSVGVEIYHKELVWREFAYHLLYHFPHTAEQPLRTDFTRFPWRNDAIALRAWQRGLTGYPMVDAGMRQLWTTGWMHNRVRMVVASFLVKHLLLSWKEGARWFWDTLLDADLASNTLGWQWSAGCGADAAPYFRIFNPVAQGEKFDTNGDYVRRWVPELKNIPNKFIHKPWEYIAELKNYPRPVVDHSAARARALEALATITKS
ncbi:MAG: deoxyribodipyrimidine photo-lyase [Planctomycetia bacterium]|nr:deoxyribodipyrimidine photo-lyase [Planctomycetia bacterium]